MKHEMDRALKVVERYLVEGRMGGVSLQDALLSASNLRLAMEEEGVKGRWYRHRIVKRKIVPGARLLSEPMVIDAERELRRELEVELGAYFRSHRPCQRLVSVFSTYGQRGLEVVAVATLYGPESIRNEVLEEFVKEEVIKTERGGTQ